MMMHDLLNTLIALVAMGLACAVGGGLALVMASMSQEA
jgi:hypothetical protein